MSYVDTLNSFQKDNINTIIDDALKKGITNPISIAGILSIISKESNFYPINENGNYSAKRICEVFNKSICAKASELANNPVALFNATYGGRYGNSADEGYKYRGRGFNQVTFKDNYKTYGRKINENLVFNPDLLLDPKIASKVAIVFADNGIDSLINKGKLSSYNAKNINDFKDLKNSVYAFYHVNAGSGKSVDFVKSLESKETGMSRALNRVDSLYQYTKDRVKKSPIKTKPKGSPSTGGKLISLAALGGIAYFIYRYYAKWKK